MPDHTDLFNGSGDLIRVIDELPIGVENGFHQFRLIVNGEKEALISVQYEKYRISKIIRS